MTTDKVGPPPTPLARRFVRYGVGFGVAVGVGLAPLLGKFRDLLLPLSLQETPLIPVSAFLMGAIAMGVQFYAGERLGRALIRRRFWWTALVLVASLLLLFLFSDLWVVRLSSADGQLLPPLLVGPSRVAGCCPGVSSNKACLAGISPDPEAIEACWGRSLRVSGLALSLSYLTVMGSFGALIGLLLLQEEALRGRRRSASLPTRTPPDSGSPPRSAAPASPGAGRARRRAGPRPAPSLPPSSPPGPGKGRRRS